MFSSLIDPVGYPFYRLLLFLIAGILCARYVELHHTITIIGLIGAFALLILSSLLPKRWFWKKQLFGFTGLVFFFFLGLESYQFTQVLPDHHFSKQEVLGKEHLVSFQLTDRLASNNYNTRFYADVTSVNSLNSTGRVLILFKRSDSVDYKVGQQLLVYDDINDASAARNPGDFNYKAYLKTIDVYGQLYVDKASIISVNEASRDNIPIMDRLKQHILNKLLHSGLEEVPRSIIEALVLGQRQNVDPEVTKSFRDAGVIHILALSGLHVGIILLILQFLTRPLLSISYGRWIQTLLIIFLLWCFAILTGMSPSIMRSVTMFSFVAVGMNIKRKASTFHSLTLSAFFLLLFDARLLFQVGFQLSYMAVYSIVLIQPILRNMWTWRHPVKNFFWSIFTVTLAAQIGVAPLSVYYFHQLPGLFLVGNMILLPMLPLIIGTSLFLIVGLLSSAPVSYLEFVLNKVLNWIVHVIGKISSYDNLIFKDLYIETYQLICIYVILFGLALFIRPLVNRSKKEQIKKLKPNWMSHVALGGFAIAILLSIYHSSKEKKDQMLVLHQARGSAISLVSKNEVHLFTDFSKMDLDRRAIIKERLINIEPHRDKQVQLDTLKNSLTTGTINLIRVDSTGVWYKSKENAVVLLSHTPKINLGRLILELKPKAILSDGSNYRSAVEVWEQTCVDLSIPFYNTYETGAIDLLQL